MKHAFTEKILEILNSTFSDMSETIFELSPLLQYLNHKTRSASRGSKSRGSFATLYAIYVLVEDYQTQNFHITGGYGQYVGARYSSLLSRIRSLPYGAKLQNHALNSRTNEEFRKFFVMESRVPIQRNLETQRYWITESLLEVTVGAQRFLLGAAILRIVEAYIITKRESLSQFIADSEALQHLPENELAGAMDFIRSLLSPEKDARLFEIASYAILKVHFGSQVFFVGQTLESVKAQSLQLYKTGRTNANDGGIDFVMRPLGRFFQVTETLDVKKYFLDIDKVERFPLSFVIKTQIPVEEILNRLREGAQIQYGVEELVFQMMNAIEEIWNIPRLLIVLQELVEKGQSRAVLEEIVVWSRVEFQYDEQIAEATETDEVA